MIFRCLPGDDKPDDSPAPVEPLGPSQRGRACCRPRKDHGFRFDNWFDHLQPMNHGDDNG